MRKVFLSEKYKLARLKGRIKIEEMDYIKDCRERRAGLDMHFVQYW